MKNKAICIRCGAFKKDAFATCKQCDLTPKNDFEAARALILSERTLYGNVEIGKSIDELRTIAESIRNGRPYPIDGDEQSRVVREYHAYLKSLPPKNWYQSAKFRWMVGAICFAGIVAIIAGYFF